MKYKSTRGGVAGLGFTDALLMGLASDGGLLVPESIPDVTSELEDLRHCSFVELAQHIVGMFVDDIDTVTLNRLIAEAYSTFDHPEVVGWQELDNVAVVELFHGPTLAFKDVALQLLGQLFQYVLALRNQRLNILGATSGDTGSAAIAGVRGQDNVDIFILYPKGRVSPLQELQMTTVPDRNVHCVEVDGTFDDCQRLMKETFADLDYKEKYQLGAVNSVNWARVLAQIVYYGYASLRTPAAAQFSVPTGNFGNVFAAYLAQRMGFPIDKLIVATNENDILARFFATGEYAVGEVHQTVSPAMDIQVASNFERFLYYYFDEDSGRLSSFMSDFAATGCASLDGAPETKLFAAVAINQHQTLAAMRDIKTRFGYVLDPHTAVGVAAAQQLCGTEEPVLCIATAHPAKFPEAVEQATDIVPTHPSLDALSGLAQRKQSLDADLPAVKHFLAASVSA
jgi:threonine synthase